VATLNELMIAYELFALVDPPHAREKTQQTPNDEAHVPDEEPPLAEHSEAVKQVPFLPFDAPHGSFGNLTTLNTLKTRSCRLPSGCGSKIAPFEREKMKNSSFTTSLILN